MKLVYKHNQEKYFKIIQYPDGQQNVELDLNYFDNPKDPVAMYVSLRNYKELEVMQCLYSSLIINDFVIDKIVFNYLFGMRCDRIFSVGQPNYFRDVLCPGLNGSRSNIKVLYPHSKLSLLHLHFAQPLHVLVPDEKDYYVIGADENACWSEPTYNPEGAKFYKIRHENGLSVRLTGRFQSQIEHLPEHKPLLIKDDLCDGGATFIAIAEYLQKHFPERKRCLFVAHGLFTKGVDHVAAHYDKVITTNSYQEFEPHPKLSVIDVWN